MSSIGTRSLQYRVPREDGPSDTGRTQLYVLALFTLVALSGGAFVHGHWFKCNDVIKYGVWQWCASYVYFRYTLDREEDIMANEFPNLRHENTDDLDNNHICRGYTDRWYSEDMDTPWQIIVARVAIFLAHASSVGVGVVIFLILGDKMGGARSKAALLATAFAQFASLMLLMTTLNSYFNRMETNVNQTKLCWNGILGWVGWGFAFVQLVLTCVYIHSERQPAPGQKKPGLAIPRLYTVTET